MVRLLPAGFTHRPPAAAAAPPRAFAVAVAAPRRRWRRAPRTVTAYPSVAVVTAGPGYGRASGVAALVENAVLLLFLVGLFVVLGGSAWLRSLGTAAAAAAAGGAPVRSLARDEAWALYKQTAIALVLDEIRWTGPDDRGGDAALGVLYRGTDVVLIGDASALLVLVGPAAAAGGGDPLRAAAAAPVDVAAASDLLGTLPTRADVRDAVARLLNVELQVPAARAAMAGHRPAGGAIVIGGRSVGGAVALGLALAVKNERLAAAWGVAAPALAAFRAAADAPARTVEGYGVGAPPFVRIDAGTAGVNGLRLDNLHTLLKEGDAVGVASAYTMQPGAPPEWELLPVGALSVVADEDWHGRDAARRWPRAADAVRVQTAAAHDDAGKRRLVSRDAFQRAATALAPPPQPGGAVAVPLHAAERYAALAALALGENRAHLPPAVEGWVPER